MSNFMHLAETFFLKCRVAYSQHFINQQDFRVQMGRDGESQAQAILRYLGKRGK